MIRTVPGNMVVSGKEVFRLMDTTGYPLDMITEDLRARGLGFNVIEFVEAALASKNFSYKRIRAKLCDAMLDEDISAFVTVLDSIAVRKKWLVKA